MFSAGGNEHSLLRILLVEDNPGDADLVREAFAVSGIGAPEVVHAERLSHGLAALRERPDFDAVLLDLSLPDATGLEGLRLLLREMLEVPLIVLTGCDSEELGASAVAEGAQDYLVKGRFEGQLLLRAVRYAAARHRFARALAEERSARAAAEARQLALREADQRKDEFLALLGHELRNPLAPILNAVELLRRAAGHPDRVGRAASIVEKQVRHMSRLVDDLLDVTRIARGKVTLHSELLDLVPIISSAVELAQPLIEAGRHELLLSLSDGPLPVEGDRTRLVQILANLLNNAAKFTLQPGTIRLDLQAIGGQAVVVVRDNGIGIAPDVLPRVFDLFVQGDSSLGRSRGGLGMGLSLAKSLVEMHGGTIEGRSSGPGQGSEFVVRLPLATRAEIGPLQPRPGESARGSPARLRVLVVDDNADAAETLSTILELMSHEVRTAFDGASGLRLAEEFRPEAVLLDLGMPRMNGYEAARRLRELPATCSALLVAVTGLGQEEDRSRAVEAGFDHYLTKPADPHAVQELLLRWAARQG